MLRMAIKEMSPDGSFVGSLAVYNNTDLGGDLIEPGAFTKTIKDHGNEVPLLWQHDSKKPIGMLTLIDGPDALSVKGQLEMGLQTAKEAYILIKARIVKGLSIGFDTVRDSVDSGVRHLKEIRLWEGSIVTFPMNEQALITSVKARREAKEDFDTEYAEALLVDAAYQMWIAVRSALCSIPWSDMTRDEKLAASEASIAQFSAAYMAMLPAYLDWLTEEYGEGGMSYYGRKPGETKSGKKISAATQKEIKTAQSHMKSADDLLTALCNTDAEDEEAKAAAALTSEGKAAVPIATASAAIDHSVEEKTTAVLDNLVTLVRAA